jgi:hypothetical protein
VIGAIDKFVLICYYDKNSRTDMRASDTQRAMYEEMIIMVSNDTITLYHGTVYDFDTIDIKQGRRYKDFGQGFYCSETRNQAVGIAIRNYNAELAKFKTHQGSARAFASGCIPTNFPAIRWINCR